MVHLATFHHAFHAPSRHARQAICKTNSQPLAGEITKEQQKPRETSRGERNSKEISGKCLIAEMGETSLTIAFAQTNTGETSGSSLMQCQRETLMTTNPIERNHGGNAFLEEALDG